MNFSGREFSSQSILVLLGGMTRAQKNAYYALEQLGENRVVWGRRLDMEDQLGKEAFDRIYDQAIKSSMTFPEWREAHLDDMDIYRSITPMNVILVYEIFLTEKESIYIDLVLTLEGRFSPLDEEAAQKVTEQYGSVVPKGMLT